MSTDKNMDDLLEALTNGLSEEDLLMAALQSDIASEITSARIEKKLSQKQLADEMNVQQSLVSRWENGDVNFTLQTLVKIAQNLGIKMQSPFVPSHYPQYVVRKNLIDIQKVPGYQSSFVSPDPVWNTECSRSGRATQEL